MPLIRKNIIANLIGSGWVAVMSFAFIPLYIHFLGIEAYGLIGFYITLQAALFLLDMGITAAVTRELARLSADKKKSGYMRNTVRTLEVVYWAISICAVVIIYAWAPWISEHWINAETLTHETIESAIRLMAVVIALRMPYGFYGGCLVGLQDQVLFNVIKVIVETLRNGGVVLILWLVSPSIVAFFQWQAFVALLAVAVSFLVLKQRLPPGEGPVVFKKTILLSMWRFTAGMAVISVSAVILTQMDKVVLSKVLPLEQFGYYMLAATLATGITLLSGPVFAAIYPKINQLVVLNDVLNLKRFYHQSCQIIAVLVIPLAVTIAMFSKDILLLWTQDITVAGQASLILSALIIGAGFNGLMQIPYALQLSYGWTRLTVYANWLAIIVLLPLVIWSAKILGPIGAAIAWLVLNGGYLLIITPIIHSRFLQGEHGIWLKNDVLYPLLASVIVSLFFAYLLYAIDVQGLLRLFMIGLSYLVACLLSLFCCDLLWPRLREYIQSVLLGSKLWQYLS